MSNILYSPADGRLRSGWRIFLFFALNFSITLLILLPTLSLFRFDPNELSSRNLLISGFVSAISLGISLFASRRGFDRKTVESLGIQQEGMWRGMGLGIGIAGVMMLFVFLVMIAGGWMKFIGFAWELSSFTLWGLEALNMVLLFLLVGITEELQFRGYLLQNLEEGTNLSVAVILSAAIFALLHIANPGAQAVAPLTGLFLAGLFFAYAYLRTRTLWLAIGLHIGWNFFASTVFGFTISGIKMTSLISVSIDGPELITGGEFGPEAGLILIPALLVGILLTNYLTRK